MLLNAEDHRGRVPEGRRILPGLGQSTLVYAPSLGTMIYYYIDKGFALLCTTLWGARGI